MGEVHSELFELFPPLIEIVNEEVLCFEFCDGKMHLKR
jgi:hypothetical protein